ncbi:hypothetical protein ACIHCQ_03850 [Streptomyces sp. NPDC052236]|uniref:hypothetical protein n=1 Tax=Streptomyces sp. NPDC052236 TaxID=3365686 RepID=UPI0037D53F75
MRAFAEHLGVAVATVSKWESKPAETEPRPDTQAILDTALGRADAPAHLRFETLLSEMASTVQNAGRRITAAGPRAWEYESWVEDLDRVVVALSRQNFAFADSLLSRWLVRFNARELDEKGLYLFARSTALLGDLKRDQGSVLGPLSAQHSYAGARAVFTQLDIPRRVAQLDLSLAVVTEMSGKLEVAAHHYETLAVDDRLSRRDRARARLWVGTALSKNGRHDYATRAMQAATRDFEDLTEPDDWSVARRTMGDWLDDWLASKKTRRTTTNGYASHIRVHLKPRTGHIRLDRLNVGHLVEMFDAIADANEVIEAESRARLDQIARCKPSKPGRPVAAERERLAVERAKLAEMKPFRKSTGTRRRDPHPRRRR